MIETRHPPSDSAYSKVYQCGCSCIKIIEFITSLVAGQGRIKAMTPRNTFFKTDLYISVHKYSIQIQNDADVIKSRPP